MQFRSQAPFSMNIRPLRLYEKIGLGLLAVPLVIFVLIPALLILTFFWVKNMRILQKEFEKRNFRTSSSAQPIQPEIIIPKPKQLKRSELF